MAETAIVNLGGREFTVRPLSFKRLRELEAAITRLTSSKNALSEEDFDAHIDILTVALTDADSSMNRDAVLGLRDTRPAMRAAVHQILKVGGYIEEKPSGESQAGSVKP